MEEKPHNFKVGDSQLTMKNLIDKPNEDALSSSEPSENKKPEEIKDTSESPHKTDEEVEPKSRSDTPARKSPEPSCAICLEQLQNKSFTDSCFHMFCFTCLVEWSKVKAECPLCKQRFKSIVHNVRSIEDYDQYYIKSKSSENIWSCFGPDRRFHRYATTITSDRYLERNRDSIESQMASHRMRYAPHAVRLYTQSQIVRMPCNFRRRIYDEHLWVEPINRDRIRFISPEFYRSNPACTHRLLPWLNRELVALLQNNETQVTFVMELIMALITRYEITSQEFFLHVEPYLSSHTSHFVHEFYNFAISPFDMENYDQVAVYKSGYETNRMSGISSSDCDVIPLSSNATRIPHIRFEQRELSNRTKRQLQEYRHLKKLILKRNSQNNSWENITPSISAVTSYTNTNSPSFFPVAGPSTSSFNESLFTVLEASDVSQGTRTVHSDDDDCQIIDVVKPKNERTPEIIEILSSDEEKVEKVINVSSDEEGLSAIGIGSLSDLFSIPSPKTPPGSGDDFNSPHRHRRRPLTPPGRHFASISSEIECIYQNKRHLEEGGSRDSVFNKTTWPREDFDKTVRFLGPTTAFREFPGGIAERTCHHAPGVTSLSTDNETSSISLSPHRLTPSRFASIIEPKTPPDSNAASSNEVWEDVNSSKRKKLKLRSVVAHFSYDQHCDSNRHSSHKKHKDKKKKKKKHTHKHKRRIYSDESD